MLMPVRLRETGPVATGQGVLAFGPFQLDLERRVLREGTAAIRVGQRALELLVALAERPGEVVTKRELLQRGWPGASIQDCVLRVQIAALRRVLGDGAPDRRYVENVCGRGYRFVARVRAQQAQRTQRGDNLPALLSRVFVCADLVRTLAGKLQEKRFVSVVGAGGMGKTTVAIALAEHIREAYTDGVRFLDLSSISQGRHVAGALAALLGRPNDLDEAARGLPAFLRGKSMLVVLDNCEHLHETVADLADHLFTGAADVHLLATSRYPLGACHEHVFRLSPLQTPPRPTEVSRDEALTFPAIQLFVERALASLDTYELTQADAPLVAQICCRLEGNPLAIELAAARLDVLGLQGLAARLGESLRILAGGRRTAAPRHQSLRATLDWSYSLLSAEEQRVVRRLAVFTGSFGVDSASAVATDGTIPRTQIHHHLARLAAKSLITADATSGDGMRYRLPQYQREYALEKLNSSGEEEQVRRRYSGMWRTPEAVRFHLLRSERLVVTTHH